VTYPAIGIASVTESPADVARLIFGAAEQGYGELFGSSIGQLGKACRDNCSHAPIAGVVRTRFDFLASFIAASVSGRN
jgi:hypothetical protein